MRATVRCSTTLTKPHLAATYFPALSSALLFLFFFSASSPHRDLHSFPTRRSSDLRPDLPEGIGSVIARATADDPATRFTSVEDRKSTRLNSSHQIISYAVFCLKKKNNSRADEKEIKPNK